MSIPSLPASHRAAPHAANTTLADPLPHDMPPPSRAASVRSATPQRPQSALAEGHAELASLRRTRSAPEPTVALRPRGSLTPPEPLRTAAAVGTTDAPLTHGSIASASMEAFEVLDRPENAQQRSLVASIGDHVLDGLRFVANNEASSRAGQAVNSVINIGVRNLASVGVTTEGRQLMTACFKAGFDKHLSAEQQTALAMTVMAVPILLNLIGAFVDHHQGTATKRSWAGRGMNLALGLSAVALAAAAGTTADNAAQCVSTFIYCAVRDAVQASLRLPDESDGQHLGAVVATGGLYMPNQLTVNRGMTVHGSPSGASAAGRIAERPGKDLVRAGINTAGETVDDVVDMALHAILQGKPFRVRLEAGLPTAQQAIDKLLRMGSARPTVFISSLLLNNLVDKCLVAVPPEEREAVMSSLASAIPGAEKCLVKPTLLDSAGAVGFASDTTFAALIGMLRIPQVMQAGQRERPGPVRDGEV